MAMVFFRFCAWWFLLLVLGFVKSSRANDEELEEFLQESIKTFPSWLIQNGLKSVSDMPSTINISMSEDFLSFNGQVRNRRIIQGHHPFADQDPYVHSDFEKKSISFYFHSTGGSITLGQYEISGMGKFLSEIPINGSGVFAAISSPYGSSASVNIKNFEVTPEGHVNLTNSKVTYEEEDNFIGASFSGLNAGGLEDILSFFIVETYHSELLEIVPPIVEHFRRFLEEIFVKNPIKTFLNMKQ